MPLTLDLAGRKVLITGVTSGIGAAIAAMFARAGSDVAGCALEDPRSPEARAFEEAVRGHGRRPDYRQADLAEPAAARVWVAEAAQALGGCDVLVSNAGRNVFKGVSPCDEADWERCMNLNLASHWRVAQAAKPWLERAAPGVVVVITSCHALATLPGCFPYNVAKAGLVALVQSLALEWGPAVRAVGIAPGFIDTPGNAKWFASFPDAGAKRRATEQRLPVGRIGTPEEIGALCVFLATPWGGFISGSTFLVDGGGGARMQDA